MPQRPRDAAAAPHGRLARRAPGIKAANRDAPGPERLTFRQVGVCIHRCANGSKQSRDGPALAEEAREMHNPLLVATATVAMLAAAGPATAAEDVLNVYNWSDYIDEDTVPEFEKEFGLEVNYDVYDSNEVLEGKLMAGNTGFDVVYPSGGFFAQQIKAGIYQKLDKSKIPNLKHVDEGILERVAKFDPGNKYGVPYMWGTTGIGYNVDMVKKHIDGEIPENSWDLIFDPKYAKQLQDCGITMLDAPTEAFPIMKNYLGIDPESEDPEDLEKAKKALREIRPYIKYYHSSKYINDLANGDICVAQGWSGDVYIARDRGAAKENPVNIDYSIPKEGTLIWFDIMAIPKDAPHPDAAHKWINFNNRPEVAAQNVNYVWYATANESALPMVKDEIRNNESIFPPEAVKQNLFPDLTNSPRYQRRRTRAWTAVKTGQ
jgi:putrescine transport system substrate-binding protein